MRSAPVRPVQDEFKGPNFWKQKSPNPTLHFPQTQLDERPLSALNTAREPAAAKGGTMKRGSAAEIIAHGQTGFLCQTVEKCLTALEQVSELDRAACRKHILQNFSVQGMVDGYEAVSRQILMERFANNGHIRQTSMHISN